MPTPSSRRSGTSPTSTRSRACRSTTTPGCTSRSSPTSPSSSCGSSRNRRRAVDRRRLRPRARRRRDRAAAGSAAARHGHVGAPRQPRGLQPLPRRAQGAQAARAELRGAGADGDGVRGAARDHEPPRVRPAADARGGHPPRRRRARHGEGRSRIPFAAGQVSMHSLSAAAVDKVSILDGEEKPVLIEITMNNSSGLYQVDGLLKEKLRGSGLSRTSRSSRTSTPRPRRASCPSTGSRRGKLNRSAVAVVNGRRTRSGPWYPRSNPGAMSLRGDRRRAAVVRSERRDATTGLGRLRAWCVAGHRRQEVLARARRGRPASSP